MLNTIYKDYQLTNKLNGYPELRERQRAANAVVKQVKTLIGIFEISSFLISAHEYELAVASYEYLESFYQSREIYNNIGPVSYTHLRAHETVLDLVCRLLLEKKKQSTIRC